MTNTSDVYSTNPKRYEAAKTLANLGGGDLHQILKERYYAIDAYGVAVKMINREKPDNQAELLEKLKNCLETTYPDLMKGKRKKNARSAKISAS